MTIWKYFGSVKHEHNLNFHSGGNFKSRVILNDDHLKLEIEKKQPGNVVNKFIYIRPVPWLTYNRNNRVVQLPLSNNGCERRFVHTRFCTKFG